MSCPGCQIELGDRDRKVVAYYGLAHRCGVVRWIGVDWYGVPFPLRLIAVWAMHGNLRRRGLASRGRRAMLRLFAGCGCVKRLKDAWTALWAFA